MSARPRDKDKEMWGFEISEGERGLRLSSVVRAQNPLRQSVKSASGDHSEHSGHQGSGKLPGWRTPVHAGTVRCPPGAIAAGVRGWVQAALPILSGSAEETIIVKR